MPNWALHCLLSYYYCPPMRQAYFIGTTHIVLSYVVIAPVEVACYIISIGGTLDLKDYVLRLIVPHTLIHRYFRFRRLLPLYIDWVRIVQYILILYSTCGLLAIFIFSIELCIRMIWERTDIGTLT